MEKKFIKTKRFKVCLDRNVIQSMSWLLQNCVEDLITEVIERKRQIINEIVYIILKKI